MKIKYITFISLNYAPEDSAIGLYSTQWVDFLRESGYEVTVVTAFPYYPKWEISKEYKQKKTFLKEDLNGTTVLRYKQYVPKNPSFLKRIIHLSDFTFGSFFNLFKIKECDLVISIVPFTTSVFLGYIQKKRFKVKLWTHIQDFEFDAALQTGVGNNKNFIFSLLFKLEKWLFSKSDVASTISYSMLNRLSEKTNAEQFFLPNWIDNEKINPENSKKHRYLDSEKIKILYSGNIGDKQDWDVFIQFCKDIDKKKYEIVVVGDGSKKEWVCNEILPFENVNYYPPVPFKELSDLLCSADVHILFQKPDVIDTVMPSKVLGMMASTKPSLIIGNDKSEVKSIFDASKAGLYYSEYTSDVVNGLKLITSDIEKAQKDGKEARNYVIENFSKEKILSNMLKKLKSL
ncbi:colanic acid biosynthesis glycosyl transferase WcaI [Winogradskyella eximia]|uniref:Colanic acid biosynthesis glycosyl transferase WcaI n=1 Tax=Winogradskyella eximia TaxID=262006 RepID=A0A3D9HA57_9FLAO|nr:WcaI family glycosyltransferase [Winogradskyella eximia]RED46390.1 colanic acid biosynthesis glycosyl transferase WcaI [Winogradskyella eximia]